MKKSEIMQIIKEAVQVVLTNEEAIEMFDLDPAALLDEMMKDKLEESYEEWQQFQDMERDQKATDRRKGRIRDPRRGGKVVSDYKSRSDAAHRDPSAEDLEARMRLEEEDLEEADRTAKGNITQDTRKKHATVGKDKFPIFDKKSAEAAIDLRGHAPEADRARIIDKAAEYAPEAAKKAREADKKKKKG